MGNFDRELPEPKYLKMLCCAPQPKDNKDKQVNSMITRYGADTAEFELVAR